MRKLIQTLRCRDKLARLSHSHTFNHAHHVIHVVYLAAIAMEGRGFHSWMGGTMAVISFIVLIGGEPV